MSTKVVTGRVRFSFVNIFSSRAFSDGQEAKYSICILIPKDDEKTVRAIRKAISEATQEGITSKWGGKKPINLRNPLRDGDTEKDTDENPEFKSMYFINASSKQKPGIVDRDRVEILDPSEVYSGCWGRVSLNFYPYDQRGNKGVGAGLNNVQKLRDGERLGGTRASAESDFGDDFEDDDYDDF